MKNIVDRKKKLILDLLKIAIQKEELSDYMLLMPNYSIESTDPNSDNHTALDYYSWEALYTFAKQNPQIPIGTSITNALNINSTYKGEQAIMATLSFIEYYCKKLKSCKKTPFTIDVQLVLDKLRNTILEDKEMYMQKKECFNKPFWHYIKQHSDYLEAEYGLTLIGMLHCD